MNGTPKTLKQAIQNGIEDAMNGEATGDSATVIQRHVRDFIAQKFQVIDDEKIEKLWQAITKAA